MTFDPNSLFTPHNPYWTNSLLIKKCHTPYLQKTIFKQYCNEYCLVNINFMHNFHGFIYN